MNKLAYGWKYETFLESAQKYILLCFMLVLICSKDFIVHLFAYKISPCASNVKFWILNSNRIWNPVLVFHSEINLIIYITNFNELFHNCVQINYSNFIHQSKNYSFYVSNAIHTDIMVLFATKLLLTKSWQTTKTNEQ